ncbi:MAG: hypothetical protein AABY07_01570 [Nanoarchaeota archaeon]|mgnify:FL=1
MKQIREEIKNSRIELGSDFKLTNGTVDLLMEQIKTWALQMVGEERHHRAICKGDHCECIWYDINRKIREIRERIESD